MATSRMSFVTPVLSLTFAACAAWPARAQMPVLQTFEDLPAGTALYNQYDGVTFVGGDQYYHPVTIITSPAETASPTRAVSAGATPPGCEFCDTFQNLNFDIPQHLVSAAVGLSSGASDSYGLTIVMSAYSAPDAGGSLIAQTQAPCMGTTGPTSVTTPLQVADTLRRIRSVQFTLNECGSGYNYLNSSLLMDNLRYDRPLNPPVHESQPPIITFTHPTNGSTVQGDAPGVISTYVTATITEDFLYSLTASLNGHTPVSGVYNQTDTHHYSGSVYVWGGDGLVDGANNLCLTATDFDRPQNTTTSCIDFTFQMKPIPPPSQVDIHPTAWEVTQSIDAGPFALRYFDYNPTLSSHYHIDTNGQGAVLLQGKPTVLRVYGNATGTTSVQTSVPAVARVEKDNCTDNCVLAYGMPPLQSPPATPKLNGINVPVAGTPGADLNAEAADLSRTWNFLIPPDWTQNNLVVYVNVNDGGYFGFPSHPNVEECPGCVGDDSIEFHLHFAPEPRIVIHPVPIHVSGTYQGRTYDDIQPTEAQIQEVFRVFNELYPGRVDRGTDIPLSGDFAGTSHDDMLDTLNDRFWYGPANEFYLGLFPAPPAGGSFAANDVGGVSYVGKRAVFAMAYDPVACVHEIGHAIGFDHWACEFGAEAADECGVFPIPHGGTGMYGLNLASGSWNVLPPGDNSGACTPHAHDFMSYGRACWGTCGGGSNCNTGEWVSWYDYDILFHHMTVDSYDADDPPAIMVGGWIDTTGFATLRPLYQTTTDQPITDTIADEAGEDIYTIQGYDDLGNTQFVHNFEPKKKTVHNDQFGQVFRFDEMVPVIPNLAAIEVFKNVDSIGYMFNDGLGNPPSVLLTLPTSGTTWNGGSAMVTWTEDSPVGLPLFALVQYSPDGGTTHVTLARDLPDTSLMVDTDEFAGTNNAVVTVLVTDGFNTATATSRPFQVAFKPPAVHISSPRATDRVATSMPFDLAGSATDLQQPLTDPDLHWASSLGGDLGTGPHVTATLSTGHHTITLSATNSHGLTGTDSVDVDVATVTPFGDDDTGFMPPAKSKLLTCENGIAKGVGKLIRALYKCEIGRVTGKMTDQTGKDACDGAAIMKFTTKAKTTGCGACTDLANIANGAATIVHSNSSIIYCAAGTPFGGDETGNIPADTPKGPVSKCENSVANKTGKLVAAVVKCHIARAIGKITDDAGEETCETTAITRMSSGTVSACDPCTDVAGTASEFERQMDSHNDLAYCQ